MFKIKFGTISNGEVIVNIYQKKFGKYEKINDQYIFDDRSELILDPHYEPETVRKLHEPKEVLGIDYVVQSKGIMGIFCNDQSPFAIHRNNIEWDKITYAHGIETLPLIWQGRDKIYQRMEVSLGEILSDKKIALLKKMDCQNELRKYTAYD